MRKDQIVHYYDTCEIDYQLLWDLNHSRAMHAGYWDETTKTLRDALRRENEVLAQKASIHASDRILDAGCGVGGSSIFLAQTYNCEVVGITLSQKQVDAAEKNARDMGVESLVSFEVMDYCHTRFSDGYFDVVWGLESICHADDKRAFIKEAWRLLKRNGRLIVADGFANQASYMGKDLVDMERWLKGWGVSQLTMVSSFESYLIQEGFQNIVFDDITSHVIPSSKRLYWCAGPAIILSKIGEWLGLRTAAQTENLHGARCQYPTLKKGLWSYGIFYAKK
ncbi:SAM-dependent methyltransferase [Candidatus Protochlamydia naegleriophila]|uniref:SAM-dependent methyltransferase n=1 Tax=Candidatus Protochlamydia naegleriophila TaxID=389348 RepID=A0A0U5JCV6_9BACT|nr:methyltransferase domain-containing protein [Candidatus Protochlamydia naegleriophila]CUI15685.1 SAM-dependent methyltransferase [Candidatus Protochlamydia naegleriophila]